MARTPTQQVLLWIGAAALSAVAVALVWPSAAAHPQATSGMGESGATAIAEPAAGDARAGHGRSELAEADATPVTAAGRKIEIHGRVTDARSRRPLAGATVAVRAASARATTDAAGDYVLAASLHDGKVWLEAACEGYIEATQQLHDWRVRAGARAIGIDFALLARGERASVRGRLLEDGARPVANAAVRLCGEHVLRSWNGALPPDTPVDATSDADGRFDVGGAPGTYMLTIRADGFAEALHGIVLPSASQTDLGVIEMRRVPCAAIAGHVVDGDGAPVAGCVVAVSPVGSDGRRTVSAADGSFALQHLPPGRAFVELTAVGQAQHHRMLELEADRTTLLEVQLPRGTHFVGGRVVCKDQPVADLEVTCTPAGAPSENCTKWVTHTGRDGTFRIEHLPPGPVDLVFLREIPLVDISVEGVAVDRDDHRFEFPAALPPVTIRGRVRDDEGRPLAGVVVAPTTSLDDASRAVSSADGSYVIVVLLSNQESRPIHAGRDGYVPMNRSVMQNMADAGGVIQLDFVLHAIERTGEVWGTLSDAAGPIAGVSCVCVSGGVPEDGRALWSIGHSDSLGRYRCARVLPGEVTVSFNARTHVSSKANGRVLVGQRTRIDATLERVARATLLVEVRDESGAQLPNGKLDVWTAQGAWLASGAADAVGRCEVRNLTAGKRRLSIEQDGYPRHEHLIELPPDGELAVRPVLRRGDETIEGVVIGGDEQPLVEVEVSLATIGSDACRIATWVSTDRAGRFMFRGLPRGRYRVEAFTLANTVGVDAQAPGPPLRLAAR